MKKLSKISESIWSDIQDRSSGEVIRDEDKFNPDYVDFGDNTTVYWAIDNLEIDGEVKFYFSDVQKYNNNGWRLPTVDEVKQINWDNIRTPWYDGCKHLKFQGGIELRLFTNGSGGFHMWTKDACAKWPTAAWSYGYDNMDKFSVDSFNKNLNRLFVFLVKDKKKVNESIWSDIQDRSSGETIRKEDDVNLLDSKGFCDYINSNYKIYDLHDKPTSIFVTEDGNNGDKIYIPLFKIEDDTVVDYAFFTYYPSKKIIGFICSSNEYNKLFFDLLWEKFNNQESKINVNKHTQYISGEITNQTVINMIKFINDNIKNPLESQIVKI